jgi:hypothetical protein
MRTRHVRNNPNLDPPDLWTEEFALPSKPGHSDIPSELFYDYRNQVERLPNLASMNVEASPASDLGKA